MRILLGINLGLGSSNFSLGDHIPNCKGILEGVGISFILPLLPPLLILLYFLLCPRRHHCPILLFFSPYWYFSILRRFSAPRSCCVFSDVLWIVHLVRPLDSTLGPSSSDRNLQGFLPNQGLDCTSQRSIPYRPQSLQQLTSSSSPTPHARKLRSRQQ